VPSARDIPPEASKCLDIMEQKETEALWRLKSAASEVAANAIAITDRAGAVIWTNSAFTRLTGYSAEEVVDRNVWFLKSGEDDQTLYQSLWETLLAGQVWQGEVMSRRKDGSPYAEDNIITPVRDGRGEITHFIAEKQDITERKELEAQVRQAQKVEGIGRLASGVAHDFNNLLAVIRGNTELLLMEKDQLSGLASEYLGHVIAAVERAATLTRQLLAFSRKEVMQSQPVILDQVIGDMVKMLKRIIGEDIDLQCHFASGLPCIEADPGMMKQVLVNLVVNARDAMPRGGRLVIATDLTNVDTAYTQTHVEARAGEFVALTVSDTGTGIVPEHLPRIFESFFTTKEAGKGTGLGLAMVCSIVKQHRGWVEVSSRVGVGTTFRLLLPALPPSCSPVTAAKTEAELPGGMETILLVEDDHQVCMTIRRVLENSGYKVLEAMSAGDALAVWSREREEISLLLTDIIMPQGVTGRELAEQLRAERQGLKVIFLSGYGENVSGRDTDFIRRTKSHFLQKPCSSRTLLETVRECLDEE
jgi:two-component system cell cycle sensor histidine kinase/response regulator CckA